mgnify:CR=1 FL=1
MKSHPKPIVVVGSSNTDMIVRLERLPRPGETVLGGRFSTAAGGKGANQAVAAARAGGRVAFVGRVGDDAFGREALRGFRRDRLRVSRVARDPRAPSGVALICVAANGENSIAVAPGANARLSAADVRRAAGEFAAGSVLLAQLEIPLAAVRAAVDLAAARGMTVILNPAPARPLARGLLRRVNLLTPNETEAEILSGITIKTPADAVRAAAKLRGMGVGAVVITLGAKGALVADAQGCDWAPGFRVRAVDTTAAGDVFNGALAVALAEGRSLREAVRFANAAAALSVTRLGAQPSAPWRREIEARLRPAKTA